jgi:hypothetical protein
MKEGIYMLRTLDINEALEYEKQGKKVDTIYTQKKGSMMITDKHREVLSKEQVEILFSGKLERYEIHEV